MEKNIEIKNSVDMKVLPKDIKLPGSEVFEKDLHNPFASYQDYFKEWFF